MPSPPSPPLPDLATLGSLSLLQASIDALPDAIFVKDLEHTWIAMNQGFCRLIGHPYAALLGRTDKDFWQAEEAEAFWRGDDEVFQSGEMQDKEEVATGADGVSRTLWTRKFPLRDAEGKVVGLAGICIDVTAIKARLREAERLETENHEQKRLISAQTAMLDQLAVPVVQLWEGILLLPLVGAISDRRAEQILESLLQAIRSSSARHVILDVTGVPIMDVANAGSLVRAVKAAGLLGCQSILVGIGPQIARTLIALDVDFTDVVTRGSLQSGLELAMKEPRR
jgi:rsbT co-antagonist protein RsbR